MCLITKSTIHNTSETPITCYKIIGRGGEGCKTEEDSFTPYQNFFVEKDILSGVKPMLPKSFDKEFIRFGYGYFRLFGGAIHSFATRSSAISELRTFVRDDYYLYDHFDLYECEIPANTPYYEGRMDKYSSYASDKIVFKKRIRSFAMHGNLFDKIKRYVFIRQRR